MGNMRMASGAILAVVDCGIIIAFTAGTQLFKTVRISPLIGLTIVFLLLAAHILFVGRCVTDLQNSLDQDDPKQN